MIENTLDMAIIVVYLLGVAGLGIALRGRQEGVRDYFLGNRQIAWPLILLSIVATETSTVTFLSVPGVAYAGDMTFLQLPLGYIVGRLGVAIFLMPSFFRGEPATKKGTGPFCRNGPEGASHKMDLSPFSSPLTLYEIFGRRFGPGVQRLNSALFIVTRSIADGLRLFLTALVVQEMTRWDFVTSVIAVGVATIIYTFFGGIRAVIWTDFVQFFVYMVGAVVAGCVLIQSVPDGWSGVWAAGTEAGKFTMLNFAFDLAKPYTFWAGLVGGGFLTAATHGADQMMVQRYLCTNSVKHARVALVSSGAVVLVQFALFLLLGIGLYAFYHMDPPDVRNDAVFVKFIMEQVPAGVRGLIIAAVFSAAMSTLSSSLNSIASAAVADLYRPLLRPGASEAHYLNVSRLLTIVAGVVQMAVAIYGQFLPDRSTVDNVLTVAAFTTGITLGVLLLSVLVPRAGEVAAILAMLAGASAVVTVWRQGPVWFHTTVAWPWFSLIGATSTLLVGAALSRFIPRKTNVEQGTSNVE